MCVIIDLGPQNPIFLWIGKDASDRVKQLADQAAVVWLANCHDGRYFGSSAIIQWDHFEDMLALVAREIPKGQIVHIPQGEETDEFKSVFQGWDQNAFEVVEPGNEFSRQFGQQTPMLFAS